MFLEGERPYIYSCKVAQHTTPNGKIYTIGEIHTPPALRAYRRQLPNTCHSRISTHHIHRTPETTANQPSRGSSRAIIAAPCKPTQTAAAANNSRLMRKSAIAIPRNCHYCNIYQHSKLNSSGDGCQPVANEPHNFCHTINRTTNNKTNRRNQKAWKKSRQKKTEGG